MTNVSRPYLSVVIGVTEASQYNFLLQDVSIHLSRYLELIIVDQVAARHSCRINSPYSKAIYTGLAIGASKARNIGAGIASGLYLWFVDSDCTFDADAFSTLLAFFPKNFHLDLLIFNRVYRHECSKEPFHKTAATSTVNLTPSETLRSVTEWSFAVRRSLFLDVGGFPLIGTGSMHPAQSGECYALICNLALKNPICAKVDGVFVFHPHYAARKPFFKTLGYYYGAGFAVCRFSPLLKSRAAFVQLTRNLVGIPYILLRPSSDMLLPEMPRLFNVPILIRPLLLLARFAGSIHGLLAFVRSLKILSKQ